MYHVRFKEMVKGEDMYPQSITCFNAEIALALASFIQRAANEPSGTVTYVDLEVVPLKNFKNETQEN